MTRAEIQQEIANLRLEIGRLQDSMHVLVQGQEVIAPLTIIQVDREEDPSVEGACPYNVRLKSGRTMWVSESDVEPVK